MTSIGEGAFYNCSSLASITIPSGVTEIVDLAFGGCYFLESGFVVNNSDLDAAENNYWGATICDKIENDLCIKDNSIVNARKNITTATIPSSVTSIGEGAFKNCSNLTSVTFDGESKLKSIEGEAFWNCSNLTSVTIPSSVTSIGHEAFDNTPWWDTYKADKKNQSGNIIYINQVAYKAVSKEITSCEFKEETVSITQYAFYGCTSLASVTFAENSQLTSIGYGAFYNCFSLASITIPSGVTEIVDLAFEGCYFLESGFVNKSALNAAENNYWGATICDQIENGLCFQGNSIVYAYKNITTVTIPSSVESIGADAFYRCTSCTDVYCYADPSKLTWNEGRCDDFKDEKATKCHVFNASAWSEFTSTVNVTFVGDLTEQKLTVTTNNIASGDFAGYWSTYYNSGANLQAPEGVKVYKAVLAESTLTLTEIADRIVNSGEAVVLKSTSSDAVVFTIAAGASEGDYSDNSLQGVDVATTISGSAYESKVIYTMAKGTTDGLGFYKYYDNVSDTKYLTNTTLAANKAFLALDAAPEAAAATRGFVFTFEDNTTGIDDVRSKKEDVSGQYYNLSGQKVAQPTKGLYIVNGKKIVVK